MKRKSPNNEVAFLLFKAEILSKIEALETKLNWIEEVSGL